MWGQVGASCEVHYSAAKAAALIGMTGPGAGGRSEWDHGQLRCAGRGGNGYDAFFSQEDKAVLADETPLCRLGTPEDVAQAVRFLGVAGSFLYYRAGAGREWRLRDIA